MTRSPHPQNSEATYVPAQKLKGFKDTWGPDMEKRMHILACIRSEARKSGFLWLDTPCLEYAKVLLGEEETSDKQTYTFLDHGQRKVALRYDLTVPFARFLCENPSAYTLPLRKAQVGKVWRAEKPQQGRYREFLQCDFDIVGSSSLASDLEVITILARSLIAIDCGPFTISLGHRQLLAMLIQDVASIQDPENIKKVIIMIDKVHKIGPEKLRAELLKIDTAEPQNIDRLLDLILTPSRTPGTPTAPSGDHALKALAAHFDSPPPAVAELQNAWQSLQHTFRQHPSAHFRIDLSLARGLDYYTGLIFETHLDQLEHFGSISSGGRYDQLCQRFSAKAFPCTGGSIGIDRLIAGWTLLEKQQSQQVLAPPTPRCRHTVYLTADHTHTQAYDALRVLAQALRHHDLRVLFSLSSESLSRQYKQAARSQARHAVLLKDVEKIAACQTDAEIMASTVRIKDLDSHQEHELKVTAVLALCAAAQVSL